MEAARGATVKADQARRRVDRARVAVEEAQRELEAAERALHRWSTGAEGERQVAEALSRLTPAGWHVLHDVHWPGRRRANLDHVLVGPGGVVVVDAKNWKARVEVRGDVLRCGGYAKNDVLASARDAASDVAVFLEPADRRLVMPALCFVGQEVAPRVVAGVCVVGAAQVVDWVTTLPVVWSEERVRTVGEHLGRTLDGATSPALLHVHTVQAAAASTGQRRTSRARRPPPQSARVVALPTRRRPGVAIRVAVVAVVVLGLPAWVPVASAAITGLVAAVLPDAPSTPAGPSPTAPVPPAHPPSAPAAPVPDGRPTS